MGLEVERKFLVDDPPAWLGDCRSDRIRQGYVALDEATEVRVREHGSEFSLTIKSGGGLARLEVEMPIDAARFEELWALTKGRQIVKRRHLVPAGELQIEVDVFEDELAGLVVAEVEFSSVGASEAFVPDAWLSLEVTEDGRYKNRSLATLGAP